MRAHVTIAVAVAQPLCGAPSWLETLVGLPYAGLSVRGISWHLHVKGTGNSRLLQNDRGILLLRRVRVVWKTPPRTVAVETRPTPGAWPERGDVYQKLAVRTTSPDCA